jgi:hypothetical protein
MPLSINPPRRSRQPTWTSRPTLLSCCTTAPRKGDPFGLRRLNWRLHRYCKDGWMFVTRALGFVDAPKRGAIQMCAELVDTHLDGMPCLRRTPCEDQHRTLAVRWVSSQGRLIAYAALRTQQHLERYLCLITASIEHIPLLPEYYISLELIQPKPTVPRLVTKPVP